MPTTQLTAKEVAKLAGVQPASILSYHSRGLLPRADGYLGNKPWWKITTIRRWLKTRRPPGRPPAQRSGEGTA